MTSTLQKPQQFSAPDPGTPDAYLLRRRVTTRTVPKYKLVPTSIKSQADVIVYPSGSSRTSVDAPYVGRKTPVLDAVTGKFLYYVVRPEPNWLKRVADGGTTENVVITEPVLVKGSPPTPQKPIPPAWDATAVSVASLQQPLRFTFRTAANVRRDQAARAGLSFLAPEPGQEEKSITHGFKIENGFATVQAFPVAGVPTAPGEEEIISPATPVNVTSDYRIDAANGKVSFYIDDVLVAIQPSRLYTFPVHANAALYTVADAIVDPALEALPDGASGNLRLAVAARGADHDGAVGRMRIGLHAYGWSSNNGLRLKLYAHGADGMPGHGTLVLPAISAYGFGYTGTVASGALHLCSEVVAYGSDVDYSNGRLYLAVAVQAATDEAVASIHGQAQCVFQVLESTASFPHRGIYESAQFAAGFEGFVSPGVRLDARAALGVAFKGSLRIQGDFATAGALGAAFGGQRLLDAAFVTAVEGNAPLAGMLLVTAAFQTAGEYAASLTPGVVTDARLNASGALSMDLAPQQVLTAAMEALGHIGVEMGEPGKTVSVWAVNTATGGSTAYEDYPFNSFAVIDGVSYGATTDGIYALTGDTDAGDPIRAHLNLGKRNFGTAKLKSMPYACLGVSSTGKMVVRVTTDGQTYTYRARSASDQMQTQRVDFGRGLRANYFTLELMNENGADFDLDVSEFAATELTRRI